MDNIFAQIKGVSAQRWLGKSNQIGIDIWNGKYKNEKETFPQWLNRVCAGDPELMKLIFEKKVLLGGRTLSNRGNKNEKSSYFNCYSSGYCEDDFADIMRANAILGLTYKAQGGQGISLTKLRPKGTPIGNRYTSDGIIPFMQLFNTTTAITSQAGSRKGALMISLDIRHKQAEEFIKIKMGENVIDKANLSLEIDDEFMFAVEKYYNTGEVVTLHEKRDYTGHIVEYDVVPIKLYKLMMEATYDWGDPGCLFVNQFRNYNIMEFVDDYQIVTCNPCGEQPLPKHFACNLGSINLAEFVINEYTDNAKFDYDEFHHAIKIAIRTLDTLIDENKDRHAIPEQKENSLNYRNIGLGVFGMAHMLFKMKIKYGSKESKEFLDDLFNFMFRTAVIEDSILAVHKGVFPKYSEKVWESTIIKNHFTEREIETLKTRGLRNCSLLSIAPTGSLATMLGRSGGAEPEFAITYTRKTDNLKDEYKIYCSEAQYYMEKFKTNELPDYFVGSADISWKDRVDVQSVIQKHIDTAISSTVNLPYETTLEEVEQLYLYAWQKKLKGITIFRDGCKRAGILTVHTSDKPNDKTDLNKINESNETENNETTEMVTDKAENIVDRFLDAVGCDYSSNAIMAYNNTQQLGRGDVIKVDSNVIGKKRDLVTGCGTLHCTAFFDPMNGDLLETYLSKGSTGGCQNFMIGLSRLISLSARGGISIYDIADQLDSCGICGSYAVRSATKHDTSKGSCCPMAVGKALISMYEEFQHELLSGDDDEDIHNMIELSDNQLKQIELPATSSNANNYPKQTNEQIKNLVEEINTDQKNGKESTKLYPTCPQCGERLYFEGGCNNCKSCAWSSCD